MHYLCERRNYIYPTLTLTGDIKGKAHKKQLSNMPFRPDHARPGWAVH